MSDNKKVKKELYILGWSSFSSLCPIIESNENTRRSCSNLDTPKVKDEPLSFKIEPVLNRPSEIKHSRMKLTHL